MGYWGLLPPGSEGMGTRGETTSLALQAPGERDADLAWPASQVRRRSTNLKASGVIPDAELLPVVTARRGRAQRPCLHTGERAASQLATRSAGPAALSLISTPSCDRLQAEERVGPAGLLPKGRQTQPGHQAPTASPGTGSVMTTRGWAGGCQAQVTLGGQRGHGRADCSLVTCAGARLRALCASLQII